MRLIDYEKIRSFVDEIPIDELTSAPEHVEVWHARTGSLHKTCHSIPVLQYGDIQFEIKRTYEDPMKASAFQLVDSPKRSEGYKGITHWKMLLPRENVTSERNLRAAILHEITEIFLIEQGLKEDTAHQIACEYEYCYLKDGHRNQLYFPF